MFDKFKSSRIIYFVHEEQSIDFVVRFELFKGLTNFSVLILNLGEFKNSQSSRTFLCLLLQDNLKYQINRQDGKVKAEK